ncbi:MAG: hypothetical protein V3W41_18055 [Planctomycetota bacterium]
MSENQDLDLAISRIVDRRESEADWARIDLAQDGGADVVANIVASLKADSSLRSFMRGERAGLEGIELPLRPRPARPKSKQFTRILSHALPVVFAALVGTWLGAQSLREEKTASPATQEVRSSDQAFADYVQQAQSEGLQLRQLAELVVSVNARDEDSKFVLTTIKRVLERRVVDGVLETNVDDGGRLVAMPVARERLQAPRSF